MEKVKVLWTKSAKKDLQQIYNFLQKVSEQAADRVISKILNKTSVLSAGHLKIGQTEPLLVNRAFDYRYLLEGNYKIIYRSDKNKAYVIYVFDTRQNPIELKRKE